MNDKITYEWYVLHTKSRFENVVHDGLFKKSIEVFFPKIKTRSKRRDRKVFIDTPLFPGYLFVKTNLKPLEHIEILKTAGAVRLIGNKNGPISVPKYNIDSLQVMITGKQKVQTGTGLKQGDRVTVISGPFAGITGIFNRYKGTNRVVVHIDALGQFAAVEVSVEDIEVLWN